MLYECIKESAMKFQTRLLHGKSVQSYEAGATVPAISQCNAYSYESSEQLDGVTVNYPLLKSNPYHKIAGDQFGNKGGGILTIRGGSRERAYAVINRLKYVKIATNIGDVRTLVIHPASTIYLHSNREAREAAGVFEDSIRVSVGIEDAEDLIRDFTEAISQR